MVRRLDALADTLLDLVLGGGRIEREGCVLRRSVIQVEAVDIDTRSHVRPRKKQGPLRRAALEPTACCRRVSLKALCSLIRVRKRTFRGEPGMLRSRTFGARDCSIIGLDSRSRDGGTPPSGSMGRPAILPALRLLRPTTFVSAARPALNLGYKAASPFESCLAG